MAHALLLRQLGRSRNHLVHQLGASRINTDMAPDRTQLQNMSKREHESFKEYTQRWRDLAAQVALPMVEREMITMIIDTLSVFYYEKLVGYMPSSFVDLVFAGERIEVGLKREKFDYVSPIGTRNRRIGAAKAKRKEGMPMSSPRHLFSRSLNKPRMVLISTLNTTRVFWPAPKTLPAQLPSSQGRLHHRKGPLLRPQLRCNLALPTMPILARALTWEETLR